MAVDTTGKKKFAFRDVRDDAELLSSGRPPKETTFNKSNPVSKKLSKLKNKVADATSKVLKSQAVSAATNALLATAAASFAAKLAGKVKLPLVGKLSGGTSKIQKLAQAAALGVAITEQMDPNKIRRPLKEGLSASASAAAKSLAETAAASVAMSLVSGAPLASGLPTLPREFKTAASLVKSPRFFNPSNATYQLDDKEKALAESAVKHVTISTPMARLYPQRGLLEDELMYRLTLIAENVYAPANQYAIAQGYGALTILEGFRAENTGTSPHEVGEALDLTLGDGSLSNASRCFALAQWMRDHLLYDQLILCFDASGGGQVWIHVSFRADSRRRQVLTKAFNDTHEKGLHLYQWAPPTDEHKAQIQVGEAFGTMLADRQARLEPVGLNTVLPQEQPRNIGDLMGAGADNPCGDWTPPPPFTHSTVGPNGQTWPTDLYWEPPVGISLDRDEIRKQIHADILRELNIDCLTPEGVAALSTCDTFDLDGWIKYSQTPTTFSDGIWWVGWNGYWLSRVVNAVKNNDCVTGNRNALSSAHHIKGSENWPTC